MAFTRVVDLVDAVEAFQLNQYAAALEGDIGGGKPISLIALNDPVAYSLRVANQDTTNGRAFKVFKSNLTDSWIDVTKAGTKIDGLQLVHQVSTPGAPGTGFTAVYPKTDDLLYYRSESGSEIALVDVSSAQTLSNKTLTSPVINAPTGDVVSLDGVQTLTNKTLTSPVIAQISNTGTLTLPTSTDTLVGRATTDTLTNKTLTSPTLTSPTITGQLLLPDGTISAPGISFSGDSDSGRYRVNADEYADVVGGPTTPAGVAVHYRKGSKFPQVGMGQIFDTGSSPYWVWGSGDVVLKIHHVMQGAATGDVYGAHFEVVTDAGSGGAGVIPDSSGMTAVIYQREATANGATRAVEAQTIVTGDVSNAHAFASSYAIEAGIHMGINGNGSYKTGVINCISTSDGIPDGVITGPATPHRADVGLLLRGPAGYHYPIRYWDEVTTGQFLFNVNDRGRVLGSYDANQAAPSYSFMNSSGVEDPSGMFWASAGQVGFSAGGVEKMRITSDGLAIKTTGTSGNSLNVVGNAAFLSGAAGTNQQFQFGRTGVDAQMVVAGAGGQYANSATQGDMVIRAESGNDLLLANGADGISPLRIGANKLAFFDTAPVAKPTVSGAKGANAALGSLMTALAALGLVTDSTSA